MSEQEAFYTMALARLSGISQPAALRLYQEMGSGQAVYENREKIADFIEDCSPKLIEVLRDWDEPLRRAAAEMAFVKKHHITPLTINDEAYPARLRECPDAPIIIYYKGNADLNQPHVVSIVGTRHCSTYGQDLVQQFIRRLHELCPKVLVVSGLAYGIDICAHRRALETGFETVGVLAHGLDTIYPHHHRDTAAQMLNHGGLLTEYMSCSVVDKGNFVRRNRIVAGISDATIVVESAKKGGSLITAGIAQDYGRAVFAFPGPVGAAYSEGCNNLIRDNGASLIAGADDLVNAMGWQCDAQLRQAEANGIERHLFPTLTDEEQRIVSTLQQRGDLQMNMLSVATNIPIGQLTALLFQMEMKGIIRPFAGGTYHLLPM